MVNVSKVPNIFCITVNSQRWLLKISWLAQKPRMITLDNQYETSHNRAPLLENNIMFIYIWNTSTFVYTLCVNSLILDVYVQMGRMKVAAIVSNWINDNTISM